MGAQPRLQFMQGQVGLFPDPLPQLLLDFGLKAAAADRAAAAPPVRRNAAGTFLVQPALT